MATSYLKQATILTPATEVDQPVPGQPEDLDFFTKNTFHNFLNIMEGNRTKSLSNLDNE